jgi:hypothetical protein
MAASPVAQLKQTKGDGDCNSSKVTNDVQDVQGNGEGTVAVVAIVGGTGRHDDQS